MMFERKEVYLLSERYFLSEDERLRDFCKSYTMKMHTIKKHLRLRNTNESIDCSHSNCQKISTFESLALFYNHTKIVHNIHLNSFKKHSTSSATRSNSIKTN